MLEKSKNFSQAITHYITKTLLCYQNVRNRTMGRGRKGVEKNGKKTFNYIYIYILIIIYNINNI